MTYRCETCGQTHDGLPDLGFRWPDPYFDVPESERATRVKGNSDTCAIDNEAFYIRGVILMPLVGTSDHFGLGVWVSQKRENFQTYLDNYDTPEIGPFFGWLSNSIPFYEPDTWAMKTRAHFQGRKQRPLIELAPCDHPLYLDYSQGVTLERAWSIAHASNSPAGAGGDPNVRRQMNRDVTPGWKLVSIDVSGAEVILEGVHLWTHEGEWRRTGEDPITVAHPSYPAERHSMFVYELILPRKTIRFAAGEFSNGVWGFYSPK